MKINYLVNYCHPILIFLPILQRIRATYDIPEIMPDDDGLAKLLLSDDDIDWEAIRQELQSEVTLVSNALLPDSVREMFEYLAAQQSVHSTAFGIGNRHDLYRNPP